MRAFAVIKKEENSKYEQSGRGGLEFNVLRFSNKTEGVRIVSLPMVPIKRTTEGNNQSMGNGFVPVIRNQSEKDMQLLHLQREQVSTAVKLRHSRYKIFQNVEEKVVSSDFDKTYVDNVISASNSYSLNVQQVKKESSFIEQIHKSPTHVEELNVKKTIRRKIFCRQVKQQSIKKVQEQSHRQLQSNKNINTIIKTSKVVATADYDQFHKIKQPILITENQGATITVFQINPILPQIF